MKRIELDDLVRDAKQDQPDVDWKAVDEKLFARLEQEPRPLAKSDDEERARPTGGRVVWIGAAFTLAAAAAALVFVHPPRESAGAQAELAPATATAQNGSLTAGQRISVSEEVAYFESAGKVRWSAPRGSLLEVERAGSPLVLSLEKGAAEAQVTPVPSGEAFAIDVTASSGAVVRVAVHGTHLRVARDGDHVTVDLTEGVVSIGAPPRRGSTIGTLVTAPAHVELDARDLGAIHVDHSPSAVRPAEPVVAPRAEAETALLAPPPAVARDVSQTNEPEPRAHAAQRSTHLGVAAVPALTPAAQQPVILTTPAELADAIAQCPKTSLVPGMTFESSLTLHVGDDGVVTRARFTPALPPEARDCSANVIYKQSKLAPGDVTVPVRLTP